jgi:hypothetical protein
LNHALVVAEHAVDNNNLKLGLKVGNSLQIASVAVDIANGKSADEIIRNVVGSTAGAIGG